GIRDKLVTGVQTCALPISSGMTSHRVDVVVFTLALTVFGLVALALVWSGGWAYEVLARATGHTQTTFLDIGGLGSIGGGAFGVEIGRASCRERVAGVGGAG